jgi:hypothetical protein
MVGVIAAILVSAAVIKGGDTDGTDEFIARQASLYVAIVGSTRPMPIRPRVARSRNGSTFQTIFAEWNLPMRVFENDA